MLEGFNKEPKPQKAEDQGEFIGRKTCPMKGKTAPAGGKEVFFGGINAGSWPVEGGRRVREGRDLCCISALSSE